MDGLDGDVLGVEVEAVNKALRGPDELIALAAVRPKPELSLQIHIVVTGVLREYQFLSLANKSIDITFITLSFTDHLKCLLSQVLRES